MVSGVGPAGSAVALGACLLAVGVVERGGNGVKGDAGEEMGESRAVAAGKGVAVGIGVAVAVAMGRAVTVGAGADERLLTTK